MRQLNSATYNRQAVNHKIAAEASPDQLVGNLSRAHRPDYKMLVYALLLLIIGLIVIYSISPALAAIHKGIGPNFYVGRQLLAIGLSVVAFTIALRVPLKSWLKLKKPLLILAALITLIAILTPVSPDYPAHRWLRLGSFSLQSAELVKFCLLILGPAYIIRFMGPNSNGESKIQANRQFLLRLLGTFGVIGVIIALIQSDLGSAIVIIGMVMAMVFAAGLPLKHVMLTITVLILGVIMAVIITPYRMERLTSFVRPDTNCLTTGYQVCNARIAIGSGGFFGQGIGRGAQAYGYLPEAENDSIYAVYAEKFGFIGSVILLGIFLGLFNRLRRIAERSRNQFSRLLMVGLLAWLSIQTIMNIGAMLNFLPLKGITLPLVSYGGTSVIFVMAALGLAFQISRYTDYRLVTSNERGGERAYTTDRRRVGRSHNTDSGRR